MTVEREIIWTTPVGPPPASTSADRCVIYEPGRFRLNSAFCAAANFALLAFVLFVALGSPLRYLAASLALVPAPWAARRAFRISFVATTDGVTVKNYWKTYDLPWAEIEGVGIGLKQQGGVAAQPALGLRLKAGGAVFASATPLRQTPRRQFMAAVLALAPSTVATLPDVCGWIGSDRALSNRFLLWWSKRHSP